MSNDHPADKALDEVLDELAGMGRNMGDMRLAARMMRDRWKAFGGEDG